MDELETLKKEKSDTEEARKITKAHIESMKKDHEEKVFDTFLLPSFFIFRLHPLRFKTTRDAVEARACRHVHVLKPSTPSTKPSFMCSRACAFPASRVLFSLSGIRGTAEYQRKEASESREACTLLTCSSFNYSEDMGHHGALKTSWSSFLKVQSST